HGGASFRVRPARAQRAELEEPEEPEAVSVPGFAMALSLASESIALPRVFQELQGAYTSWPWKYMAQPEKMYARARRNA
ncbi:hypothetical protein ACWCRC_42095, partial [Streptomyces sp. NPDC001940]